VNGGIETGELRTQGLNATVQLRNAVVDADVRLTVQSRLLGDGYIYGDLTNEAKVGLGDHYFENVAQGYFGEEHGYGTIEISGNYIQHQGGQLNLDIGFEEIDRLIIQGTATLGGDLQLFGFFPYLDPGTTFEILTAAGGIVGTFDQVSFPTLPEGLAWQIDYSTGNSVVVGVVNDNWGDADGDLNATPYDHELWAASFAESAFGLPTDFNHNGAVDAADYVLWRKMNAAGTSAIGQIPEPSVLFQLIIAALLCLTPDIRRCRGLSQLSRCILDSLGGREPSTKKATRCIALFPTLALMAIVASTPRQTVAGHLVYATTGDNNLSFTGVASYTALEIGNQIRLAGQPRRISSFSVNVTPQDHTVTADFKARFYANDGPGGYPGSLLLETDWIRGISTFGQYDEIGWDLSPPCLVPNEFTWTLQVENATPVAVGLPEVNPSMPVGEFLASWFGGPSGWAVNNSAKSYDATICAVPEPTVLFLSSMAFVLIASGARFCRTSTLGTP
jgi:hypothetical protein